ncbi:hypothetical protein F5878DRAFT_122761 [Lentinula raphanica]|uniref:Uncharacterized protein n=1 Tax=Lentinula raphanica TaxID=153919 RepID=A0AA38PAK3_9AGAR|nr:hypothetical protein F5878DRAFT_122761 [Lentinula raphanica]
MGRSASQTSGWEHSSLSETLPNPPSSAFLPRSFLSHQYPRSSSWEELRQTFTSFQDALHLALCRLSLPVQPSKGCVYRSISHIEMLNFQHVLLTLGQSEFKVVEVISACTILNVFLFLLHEYKLTDVHSVMISVPSNQKRLNGKVEITGSTGRRRCTAPSGLHPKLELSMSIKSHEGTTRRANVTSGTDRARQRFLEECEKVGRPFRIRLEMVGRLKR